MDHQDFVPVEIGNPKNTQSQNPPKKTIASRSGSLSVSKALLEDGAVGKPKTYSATLRKNLVQLRSQRKLTQEDLARQLAVPVSKIKDMENGKGIYDGQLVQKINSRFKVSLNSDA